MSDWQRWKNIMKCYPFEEKRLARWTPPYIVQPKYDGDRCRAIRLANGNFVLLSSEENIISSCPHINKILDDNSTNLPEELDGELYCHGMSHELIHGIVSRSVNLHPQYQNMQYHIFDIVNEDVQAYRLLQLRELPKLPSIVIAPYWICYNLDDITRVYDEIINQGYEGIIVRNIENYYERKRSTLVMKFKPKQEDSYQIVTTLEEQSIDGEYKDTLGAIVANSGEYGPIDLSQPYSINWNKMQLIDHKGTIHNIFSIGTGYSDDRRKELWNGRGLLPDQKVLTKFQHITSGKRVPRFPVFVEVEWNV